MNYKFLGFLIFLVLFSFSSLEASEIKDKALYNKYLKQVEGYLNSLKDDQENYFSNNYGNKYFSLRNACKIGLIRDKIDDIANDAAILL
jgi:hypothetical protein